MFGKLLIQDVRCEMFDLIFDGLLLSPQNQSTNPFLGNQLKGGHRRAYSVLHRRAFYASQVFDVPGFILKNMGFNFSWEIDFNGRAAKYL